MKKIALDIYHPVIAVLYFAALLVFTMAAIQPVYIVVSLTGALSFSSFLKGWRRTLKSLIWQIPLIVIITFVNPLFSPIGTTEVFRIGARAFYLESFIYGASFGMMLVAVLLWFSNASFILLSDKITSLLGNRVPTLSLMISMMLRLVPKFFDQAREIDLVQRVNIPRGYTSRGGNRRRRLLARVRQSSVLMSWSMEDSLDTADAMKARGWGAVQKRTPYQRHHIKARDRGMLAVLVFFILMNAFLMIVVVGQFEFYPTTSTLVLWWGYLPYVLLTFLPLILQGTEELRWMR